MSDRRPPAASSRYSVLAEDFLKKVQSFQDPTARAQMLKLADHCDRMAKQAEAAGSNSLRNASFLMSLRLGSAETTKFCSA